MFSVAHILYVIFFSLGLTTEGAHPWGILMFPLLAVF